MFFAAQGLKPFAPFYIFPSAFPAFNKHWSTVLHCRSTVRYRIDSIIEAPVGPLRLELGYYPQAQWWSCFLSLYILILTLVIGLTRKFCL